jgi:putative spermidine/putrescine transport system substrate-binding protein
MYITYGPTNKAAYDIATVGEDVLKALPSYPANAELQLPVSLEWYAKWETKAAPFPLHTALCEWRFR